MSRSSREVRKPFPWRIAVPRWSLPRRPCTGSTVRPSTPRRRASWYKAAFSPFENNRDWRRSALLDQHEAFLEAHARQKSGAAYSRFYRDHPYAQELFRAFGNVRAESFEWVRQVPVETFLTMAESSTIVQSALTRTGYQEGIGMMKAYSERHADPNGLVSLPYIAEVYLARSAF
jgi:hypothetical protein